MGALAVKLLLALRHVLSFAFVVFGTAAGGLTLASTNNMGLIGLGALVGLMVATFVTGLFQLLLSLEERSRRTEALLAKWIGITESRITVPASQEISPQADASESREQKGNATDGHDQCPATEIAADIANHWRPLTAAHPEPDLSELPITVTHKEFDIRFDGTYYCVMLGGQVKQYAEMKDAVTDIESF